MRKHIAILIPGGIGTGSYSQGIPVIHTFVDRLKLIYKVTVFSLHPINAGFKPQGYELIAPLNTQSLFTQILWLQKVFARRQKQQRIDLIHVFWGFPAGFLGVLLKFRFRLPLIIHLQGGDATAIQEINYGVFQASKVKKALIKWTYQQTDELITLTNFQQSKLQEHFTKKTTEVIPFGVNTALFQPKTKELKPPYQFLHLAHLNPVKSQTTLLDAFQKVCKEVDGQLFIVGGDTLAGALEQYSKRLGINDRVSFVDIVPYQQTVDYLDKAHILLHTSLYEGQAMVVAEAMASGVVVCGTKVGLIDDLEDECTLASPIKDSQKLAQNVLKLLKNEALYRHLQAKGVAWSQQHDIDWTIQQFDNLYQKHLG
ncbi:hypothetical protein BKI52_39575 [marine bacterium AO1-C]|nr:hypothetical protein BKI52_39575 [marine bacterium AO1-C]